MSKKKKELTPAEVLDMMARGQFVLGGTTTQTVTPDNDPTLDQSSFDYDQAANYGQAAANIGTDIYNISQSDMSTAGKVSMGVKSGIDTAATVATPWYGYAKGLSDTAVGFTNTEMQNVNGVETRVSTDKTSAGLNAAFVPAHEQAIDSFTQASRLEGSEKTAKVFEGIGDLVGFTTIPKMIRGFTEGDPNYQAPEFNIAQSATFSEGDGSFDGMAPNPVTSGQFYGRYGGQMYGNGGDTDPIKKGTQKSEPFNMEEYQKLYSDSLNLYKSTQFQLEQGRAAIREGEAFAKSPEGIAQRNKIETDLYGKVLTDDERAAKQRAYEEEMSRKYPGYALKANLKLGDTVSIGPDDFTIKETLSRRKPIPGMGGVSEDWKSRADMEKDDSLMPRDRKVLDYQESLDFNYPTATQYHSSPDLTHSRIRPIAKVHDGAALSPLYKRPTSQDMQPIKIRGLGEGEKETASLETLPESLLPRFKSHNNTYTAAGYPIIDVKGDSTHVGAGREYVGGKWVEREYKMGGQMNRYAEGGQLTHYNGLPHELGGIPLKPGAEVEDGETGHNDFVFSDQLVDPIEGKTYADVSKKLEKDYKDLTDPRVQKDLDLALEKLKKRQEAQKRVEGIATAEEFRAGGSIKKYFEGGGVSDDDLANTFNQYNMNDNEMADYISLLQEDARNVGLDDYQPAAPNYLDIIRPGHKDKPQLLSTDYNTQFASPELLDFNPNVGKGPDLPEPYYNDPNFVGPPEYFGEEKVSKSPKEGGPDYESLGLLGANVLASNIGNIAMARKLKDGYDTVRAERISPQKQNISEILRSIETGVATSRYNNRMTGRGSVGAEKALLAEGLKAKGRAYQAQENKYIDDMFKADQFNAQQDMLAKDLTARNKGAHDTATQQMWDSVGSNVSGAIGDYGQYQENQEMRGLLDEYFSDYEYKKGKWKRRK